MKRLLVSIQPELVDGVYIFQDGLPDNFNREQYDYVTQMINAFADEHKNVEVIQRENNYGLRDNILAGVDELTTQVPFILVLEDDLEFDSGGFAEAIKELEMRKADGVHFQLASKELKVPDGHMSCWGWAISAASWPGSRALSDELACSNFVNIKNFFRLYKNESRQIFLNLFGLRKTWAIFWWFYIFCNNIQISTLQAEVVNTGTDGSGVHFNKNISAPNREIKNKLLGKFWYVFAILSYLRRGRIKAGWLTVIPKITLPAQRVNIPTYRVGSQFDGGYPIPQALECKEVDTIISLGLHDNFEFEQEILVKCTNAHLQMFDGSISSSFTLKRVIINVVRRRWSRVLAIFWSLSVWLFSNVKLVKKFVKVHPMSENDIAVSTITRDGEPDRFKILKMDIEGDEYEVLPVLGCNSYFDVILVELHDYLLHQNGDQLTKIVDWSDYLIYYVNVNNYTPIVNGVPYTIELGLVKRNLLVNQIPLSKNGGFASFPNNPLGSRIVESSR